MSELLKLKQEKLHRLNMLRYRKDPMAWLEERFGEDRKSFQWSLHDAYDGHTWDGDKDPIYNAWMSLADGNWSSLKAATGTSKTYALSRIAIWFLDCFEDSLIVTSAPKEAQLKLNLWKEIGKVYKKFQKIRPEVSMTSLKLAVKSKDSDDPYAGWQAIGFVAGVGADEESATKAQGFHRKDMLLICEETPGMSNAVLTAFKNTCTGNNNLILAVGNPDSQLDCLHTFSELANVRDYRISGYDYPNVVIGAEIYPGAVTQASIDRRREEYGEESGLYLSRVRGISPAQSADSLIRLEWIKQCINKKVENNTYYYNAVGIDVANSELGDKGAACYGKGATCINLVEFKCPSASAIAYNMLHGEIEIYQMQDDLRNKRLSYNPESLDQFPVENVLPYYDIPRLSDFDISEDCVGIDNVGVGVSTLNTFNEMGMKTVGLSGGQWEEAIPLDAEEKAMFKFISLRAQMYYQAREDLRLGNINIAIEDESILYELTRELVAPKFKVKDAAIYVEKKEEIIKRLGKSPNKADAFVYWNWMRHGFRVRGGELPFIGG